jgi:hypothetical protein
LKFRTVFRTGLLARVVSLVCLVAWGAAVPSQPQNDPNAAIIQGIDAAVHAREDHLLGYIVTEHYAVFRKHDEQHPAAEMVLKTTYRSNSGKNFTVVSTSGSLLLRKMLEEVLATEKKMTQPANRITALITPANYEMTVKGTVVIDGSDCIVLAIKPRRLSPYLFNGTVWVDARNQAIVQLEGVAAKSPSVFSGPTQLLRQYTTIDGFPMATHARAVSNSSLLGQTVIKIDYSGYQIQAK